MDRPPESARMGNIMTIAPGFAPRRKRSALSIRSIRSTFHTMAESMPAALLNPLMAHFPLAPWARATSLMVIELLCKLRPSGSRLCQSCRSSPLQSDPRANALFLCQLTFYKIQIHLSLLEQRRLAQSYFQLAHLLNLIPAMLVARELLNI